MNPYCILLPPTVCCPTHPIICDKLTLDPLLPHNAIINGLLCLSKYDMQLSPIVYLTLESVLFNKDYSVYLIVIPGLD